MKTNDLISLLAQDAPVRMRLSRMLAYALLGGFAVSAAILLSTIGLRHNLTEAIQTARVLFKISLTIVLAVTACGLVFRIGRPGEPLKARSLALLLPLAALAIGVVVELFVLPPQAWEASMVGGNAAFCLFFIPVLSVAPLAGFLWALRNGAPESPGLAGAAAGLAAGAVAGAIYAWHCPDDSPLFLATWYTIAISLVTIAGYLSGRRWLRW